MKYTSYPIVDEEGLPDDEREVQSHLLLIEEMQKDMWGEPINDGNILKPSDPQLMFNWIAGGIFQYKNNGNIISSTYALSRPEDDAYIDNQGIKWSGLGCEYFIETPESADWAIGLLVNVAAAVFKEDGMMMTPGMMINAKSGFIPESLNPKGLHLLCIINCEFDMPDGKCEYLKFVPMDNNLLEEYMALGDNKAKLATSWYLGRRLETCFKL